MNTEELYKRKMELSSAISSAVSELYNDFVNETGISPDYIGISLVDVTETGDERRQRAIGHTDIDIRI